MESYKNWIIEEESGICWLRLNRPDKMNAFSTEVALEFGDIIKDIKKNQNIRILVISGTKDDYFSAGADVEWFMQIDGPQAVGISYKIHQIFGNLEKLSIPVIAAVKGLCLTAGLELSICCDMIYAAENAKFGQIECRFGITPGGGGTQRLTQLIGPLRTKELIYSGRVMGANEANRIGLVNAVFPLEGFDEKINKICRGIMMNSAESIRECKFMIQQATYVNNDGFHREEIVFGKRFASGEPSERLNIMVKQQKRTERREEREKNKKEQKEE